MAKRDFYFDNAKFILIVFVVFGHFIRSYIEENSFIFALYIVIYFFHMPGFIFVSGFFSKSFHKPGYIKKMAKKMLLPYFIFQTIYSVFYFHLLNEETFKIDFLIPHWSLWFLLSLFYWNVLLVVFVKWLKLKPATAVIISFILGLTVGIIGDYSKVLSFARTFVFFPFFLIGFYLKKEHFFILSNVKTKLLLSAIAISVFLYAY
ncbi:MAG TPA: acyltransferase family protein, partial [Chondromyces sp.]|nr:acyltransferase family protein [Chondromyces sp.]